MDSCLCCMCIRCTQNACTDTLLLSFMCCSTKFHHVIYSAHVPPSPHIFNESHFCRTAISYYLFSFSFLCRTLLVVLSSFWKSLTRDLGRFLVLLIFNHLFCASYIYTSCMVDI